MDHGTWPLRDEDEGAHPVGVEPLWSESVYLDFTTQDGSIAGYIRLGLYPNWNRAWYWACLVGKDRPTVLLADNHAPLPGPDLAVKGEGCRATHEVTLPMRSFGLTLNAEAAVVLDDPAQAYADTAGARATSLEFDLEWKTVGGVYPYGFITRYRDAGQCSGFHVGSESPRGSVLWGAFYLWGNSLKWRGHVR
ncbi:hypothetical protein AB0M44_23730 [Streptosporangium subroseum]|uniref:hypothetical protein n=1 Tax=Streptosporangium subroseum TaxID=106412 RepID=UPI003422B44A